MVQYLADRKPEYGLAPRAGSWERVRLQEWLNFITSEIHAGSAPLFNSALRKMSERFFGTSYSDASIFCRRRSAKKLSDWVIL
jgi:glutathione S-transferase